MADMYMEESRHGPGHFRRSRQTLSGATRGEKRASLWVSRRISEMTIDLTFGPLVIEGVGNVGAVHYVPTFPKAAKGFSILWTDLNAGDEWSGSYWDRVWITDDRHDNRLIFNREFQVWGLHPGHTLGQNMPIYPREIPRGKYTFHVWINALQLGRAAAAEPYYYQANNYSWHGGVDVR
jgi:hypothetical protein